MQSFEIPDRTAAGQGIGVLYFYDGPILFIARLDGAQVLCVLINDLPGATTYMLVHVQPFEAAALLSENPPLRPFMENRPARRLVLENSGAFTVSDMEDAERDSHLPAAGCGASPGPVTPMPVEDSPLATPAT